MSHSTSPTVCSISGCSVVKRSGSHSSHPPPGSMGAGPRRNSNGTTKIIQRPHGNNGHVTSSSRPHLARSNSSIPPVDTGSKIVEALPGGEYKVHGRLLKPNQLAIFQEAFNMFDKDGEGTINAKKLGSVLRSMGLNPTESELFDIIHEVDINGNGTIEFFEFLEMMSSKVLNDPYAEFKAAFKLFDKDGNGKIDRNELRLGLRSIGENLSDEDLEEIWQYADDNKDGWISFEEFLRMMTL